MAEVASLGLSSQSSSDAAPDMPDGLVLSPSVKEAMDRILPRSASQLLQQHRLSTEDVNSQKGRVPRDLRVNSEKKDNVPNKIHLSSEQEALKKTGLKKRVSRADLEIIQAGDTQRNSSERGTRRLSLDRQNDCPSKTHSDSDDVSRPFAAVREKKKEKRRRKKKQAETTCEQPRDSIGHSEEDFISPEDKEKQSEKSLASLDFPLSDIEIVPKSSNRILTNGSGCHELTESDSLSLSLTGDGSQYNLKELGRHQNSSNSDDMSNNSFSSTKENVEHRKKLECQKLPRVKLSFYNILKHKKKIKKTFPPCYVVIEQISMLLSHANEKILNLAAARSEGKEAAGTVLPLAVRRKFLSSYCAKELMSCRKNNYSESLLESNHKTIFENMYIPDSEDDFEVVRGGRSLRKRDKTISYVEPTEADIFLEYSRKRPRNKVNDDTVESDQLDCSKKKKLNTQTEEPVLSPENSGSAVSNETNGPNSDKTVLHDYAKAKPPPNSGPKEVVVYPKQPTKDPSNRSSKSKPTEIRAAAASVSASSTPSGRSMLTSQPAPALISTFPPFLTSMSASPVPITPALPPTLSSSPLVRPQFCMVKMDGKNVLLPFLPGSSSGTGTHGPTLLLPGGKRLVVPPNHQLCQQISQSSRMMGPFPPSAMPTPLVTPPGLTQTSASSINSAASSCLPLPIPTLSTPLSYNIRGLSSTSLLQATRTVTPVTVYPPNSITTQRTLAAATTAPQSQAPVAMAAPNSTSVVRNIRVPASNLRVAAPNQPGAVRAVRIFVPGCQATGVPGRFATLGTVANNTSALTRLSASSDLLPQRQQTKDQFTPEQRAEKRRKLEKKYPLPPGVVIKTEPLDSPTQSTSTYSRSLLPGNIQVVSQAGRRPGVQSIRFLNPASAAAALGSSAPMSLSNFIVRAASGDGRQTLLIPSSLGMLTTSSSVRSSTANAASGPTTQSTSSSVIVTHASSTPVGTISILPTFTSPLNNCSTTNTTSSFGSVTGSQSLLSTGDPVLPVTSSSSDACSSSPPTSLPRTTPATGQSATNVIGKLKAEVETMSKLLDAQKAMGLRGDRIEKLKELLKKKKELLKDALADTASETSIAGNSISNLESVTGQTETEPIEID
ncbi:hypothetical protein ElyMa_005023100 [Elysia marginata]|uniref:Uncharacterized protein n=1 Tax=Elysia marginata TaxID=1093978 RepID=A0AAV4JAQ1_9GAST|nr:hypothetical protein ElyMa_005023100 [Elysia marginata]